MLRQGPFSRFVHGAVEYLAGVLFIAAPFLFAFESDAAVAVSIVAGVVVIAVAASTEGPSALIDSIPIAAHLLLEGRVKTAVQGRIARPTVRVRLRWDDFGDLVSRRASPQALLVRGRMRPWGDPRLLLKLQRLFG